MRFYSFLILSISFVACQSAATDSAAPQPLVVAATKDALLVHSSMPLQQGDDIVDLCKVPFNTTLPLFPDLQDPQKRYFIIAPGTNVVMVSAGNTRSTFMLQAKGQQFELLSSNQFPNCLSNAVNFHFYPAHDGFEYDGGRYTRFKFQIVPNTPSGYKGEISWDKGKELGLVVRNREK